MPEKKKVIALPPLRLEARSAAERSEMTALGLLSAEGGPTRPPQPGPRPYDSVPRLAIKAPSVLNEAYDYPRPSSFSRGLRLELGDYRLLLISGTASVNEAGATVHPGDFRAQCWRTYRNITALLAAEGALWQDVIRTTCYLRDIEMHYRDFNEIRTAFFQWLALEPLPASTGIEARLCRPDLLVEIEAMALLQAKGS
jgi:2-iminobutanoate/2-iminopropanoate deaminase